MTRTLRRCVAVGAATMVAAGLGITGQAAAQVHKGGPTLFVKQNLPAGCSSEITAIEYLAADKLWFTTINGEICRKVGSGYQNEASLPGVVFTDIEFRGNVGLASAQAKLMYRSTDGGDSWNPVSLPEPNDTYYCYQPADADDRNPDISHVRFANDLVVFAFGNTKQIFSSTDGGASWSNWNRYDPKSTPAIANDDECRYNGKVEDAFFPGGAVGGGWFTGTDGTRMLRQLGNATATESGLESRRNKTACNQAATCTLTGDRDQPAKQVASGGGYLMGTEDTWDTEKYEWDALNRRGRDTPHLTDVAYAGGVAVAVGRQGQIYNSFDLAETMYQLDPPVDVLDVDFNAVSMYDARHAAVGGKRGTLLLTEYADYRTDVARPTLGAVAGPEFLTRGQSGTYTVPVSDDGYGVAPEDIVWTGPNGFMAVGPTITYAAPAQNAEGWLTVNAKDRTGNQASEVFRYVDVREPVAPRPGVAPPEDSAAAKAQFFPPGKDLPATLKPKRPSKKSLSACVRKNKRLGMSTKKAQAECKKAATKVTFNIAGVLQVPAGFDRARACNGEVSIFVIGTKPQFNTVSVAKVNSSSCKFGKRLSFKPKGNRTVTIRLRYPGTTGVVNPTYSKKVKVKY